MRWLAPILITIFGIIQAACILQTTDSNILIRVYGVVLGAQIWFAWENESAKSREQRLFEERLAKIENARASYQEREIPRRLGDLEETSETEGVQFSTGTEISGYCGLLGSVFEITSIFWILSICSPNVFWYLVGASFAWVLKVIFIFFVLKFRLDRCIYYMYVLPMKPTSGVDDVKRDIRKFY